MSKKNALGKGIGSLIQNTSKSSLINNTLNSANINKKDKVPEIKKVTENNKMVPIEKILVNEFQPRKIFKEKDLTELSDSIKANGIIQPLIVTESGNKFELIAGERRLRASKLAGLEYVPVVVKKATDREKLVFALIENVQRSDLNCVEEALAYYQLMEDFNLNQEEVAKKIGKNRSTIANFLRILKLPRTVIDLLQKELLTFGHGKVLAGILDKSLAEKIAKLVVEKNLSVRELEELVKTEEKITRNVKKNDKVDMSFYEKEIQERTGFHLKIKSKQNGSGQIVMKYEDKDKFNEIYDFLMRNR